MRAFPKPTVLPRALRVLVAAVTLSASVALAQSPGPTPTPGSVVLELIDQPVWHAPGDRLGLRVRVTNQGSSTLEGFRVVVGVYDRVTTRSGLVNPPAFTPPSSLPFQRDEVIEPGGTVEIEVDEPLASFPTLAAATAGGVYPATFSLTTTDGVSLAASNTFLIYYPQPPEVRLNLALLLPLNLTPERGPDGSFMFEDESAALPQAISGSGWLSGYLAALDQATTVQEQEEERSRGRGRRGKRREPPPPPIDPMRISIAPTARLIEELADLRDGGRTTEGSISATDATAEDAARVLSDMAALFPRPEVQTILTPYAFPDIPTLVDSGSSVELLAQHNATAKDVFTEAFGSAPTGGWYFPPAGRLDSPSLGQLQLLDEAQHVFLSDRSVEPLDLATTGCPGLSQTFTCAAEVRTTQGASDALIADTGLTDILADLPGAAPDRLTLQRFFAETSMIREEVPGVPGRVVQVTIPSQWHPAPATARLLFEGLREAPWLTTVTAQEALDASEETRERDMVADADPIATAPSTLFFDQVADTASLIESFGHIVPSDSQRITRLRRNLLVATSRTWWRRPLDGGLYLEGSEAEIDEEFSKIQIESPPGFTFTDRQGELQFRITNGTNYPVRLSLRFISPNLTLSQNGMTDVYAPGSMLIRVEAEARTSGDFPIAVRLTTPDGYPIDEEVIRLRSTSLNRIALAITVGALVFLFLFYVTRSLKRKKAPRETEVSE